MERFYNSVYERRNFDERDRWQALKNIHVHVGGEMGLGGNPIRKAVTL